MHVIGVSHFGCKRIANIYHCICFIFEHLPPLSVKFPFEFWHRFKRVDIVCILPINDAPPSMPTAEVDKFCDEVDIAVSTLCTPPPYNVLVECNRSSPNIKCGSEHPNVAIAKTIIPVCVRGRFCIQMTQSKNNNKKRRVKKKMTEDELNGLADEFVLIRVVQKESILQIEPLG